MVLSIMVLDFGQMEDRKRENEKEERAKTGKVTGN